MKEKIYEHLKTRKKYNTLELKYDVKCEELEKKIFELSVEKRTKQKQQEIYEEKIKELTEQNIELKQKLTELKKKSKDREVIKNEKDNTR